MKRFVISICTILFFIGFTQSASALSSCFGFDSKAARLPKYAEKAKNFDPRKDTGDKVASGPGDQVVWFAGGWGYDNEGGHTPNGATRGQWYGFSLWAFHSPVANGPNDPRNDYRNSNQWESISISCSGDNCQYTTGNTGYSAFYTCNKPGTTVFTAHGTYRDSDHVLQTATPTSYTLTCADAAPIGGFTFNPKTILVGETATIDPIGLTMDPDPLVDPFFLGYHYRLTKAPVRSRAALVSADSISPQLIPDVPGVYQVEQVVDDCALESEPFRTSIKVGGNCNQVRAKHRAKSKSIKNITLSFLDADGQTCSDTPDTDDDGNGCVSCKNGLDHTRYPVNVATGAMWHNNTDFVIAGRTPETALSMSRNYTANASGPAGELGPNWRHGFETSLVPLNSGYAEKDIEWIDENSNPYIFKRDVNNNLNAPRGSRLNLRQIVDGFELTKPNKTVLTFSRVPFGKLTKIKERHGEEVNLTYDVDGKLSTITSPFAGTLTFTHNSQGKISSVTRIRDNLTYTYDYNGDGRLAIVTDFAGKTYKYTYISSMPGTFANGMLATITDPLGRVTYFSYDEKGRALEQHTSAGGKMTFAYSEGLPRTTVVKDIDGASTVYKFDNNFRTIEKQKADGGIIKQSWNSAGFLSSYTDELGFTTNYSYDVNGNITSIHRPQDAQATTIQYDLTFNVPTLIAPAIGASTDFTLDPNTGEVLRKSRSTQAGVLALDYTRDTFGNVLSVSNGKTTYGDQRDGNGLVTTWFNLHNPEARAYDARGRVSSRTFQSGKILQYTYDDYDRVLSVSDNTGPSLFYEYDAMGRVLKTTLSDGHKPRITSYLWDESDRLLRFTDAVGRVTKFTYDKWRIISGPSSVIDPAGRITKFEYDVLGRQIKKVDPRGAVTTFAFNQRGNMTSATDANGNITTYEYDGNGRKVAEIRPSMQGTTSVQQVTRYAFDDADSLLNVSHESTSGLPNRAVSFVYDDLNRLVKKTLFNDGSGTEVNFTYEQQLDAILPKTVNNEVANLTFVRESAPPFAIIGFSQSAANSANPYGLIQDQFVIDRDVTGNISSITGLGSGQIYSKGYDAAGRLINVNAGALKALIEYDGFGQRNRISYGSGETQSISYDPLNRITNLRWTGGNEAPIDERLAYDVAGNISRLGRENGTYEFTYDEANQLVGSRSKTAPGVPSYNRELGYDMLGNRIKDSLNGGTESFAGNFLLHTNTSSYEADAYGYGQVAKETSAGQVKNYNYRADGKISDYTDGALRVSYLYDGLDRLVVKSVSQDSATYTQTYLHLGAEGRVLLGKAGDGIVTKYVDGQGTAEHLGEVKGNIAKPYITDHLGSVLNAQSAGFGKTYGIFGEPVGVQKLSPNSSPLIYGYAGQIFDAEIGLNRTRNRLYDPKTGRWLSQDPLGLASGDSNYYRYVYNNSPLYFDPSGAICMSTIRAGGLFAGAGLALVSSGISAPLGAAIGGCGVGMVISGMIKDCEPDTPLPKAQRAPQHQRPPAELIPPPRDTTPADPNRYSPPSPNPGGNGFTGSSGSGGGDSGGSGPSGPTELWGYSGTPVVDPVEQPAVPWTGGDSGSGGAA